MCSGEKSQRVRSAMKRCWQPRDSLWLTILNNNLSALMVAGLGMVTSSSNVSFEVGHIPQKINHSCPLLETFEPKPLEVCLLLSCAN